MITGYLDQGLYHFTNLHSLNLKSLLHLNSTQLKPILIPIKEPGNSWEDLINEDFVARSRYLRQG